MSTGSLQTEVFRFLTKKSLTQRLPELRRKEVPREESLQKWSVPLLFRRHLLLAPLREKMLGWMELFYTESNSFPPYTLATSIPSHLQPRFHVVFQFLSSLRETASIKRHYCWCNHQWLLLKIHAEMCAVHREAELKYPSLLPSLPSSTCNRKSRNLSTTISCQKAIYIP